MHTKLCFFYQNVYSIFDHVTSANNKESWKLVEEEVLQCNGFIHLFDLIDLQLLKIISRYIDLTSFISDNGWSYIGIGRHGKDELSSNEGLQSQRGIQGKQHWSVTKLSRITLEYLHVQVHVIIAKQDK